jgi:hypothetical protein
VRNRLPIRSITLRLTDSIEHNAQDQPNSELTWERKRTDAALMTTAQRRRDRAIRASGILNDVHEIDMGSITVEWDGDGDM